MFFYLQSWYLTFDAFVGHKWGKGESCQLTGLAISHLASDAEIAKKSGKTFTTTTLAKEYSFTDEDGNQPEEFFVERNDSLLIPSWLKQIMSKLSIP